MGMEVIHWPIPGTAGARWQARPFGQTLADLEADLHGPPPLATTAVLGSCLSSGGAPVGEAAVWSWSVQRRLQGLLAVTAATRGDAWTPTFRCTDPACGEPMDLPLRLSDFQRTDDPARIDCAVEEGVTLTVNLPTGEHQRRWLAAGESSATELAADLLENAPEETLPAPWLAAIETALEEADPLTGLEIHTTCPSCGAAVVLPLDLERECLTRLATEQPRLLDEVHRLALAYHWSEAEILAVPPARRRQYLQRIDGTEWS